MERNDRNLARKTCIRGSQCDLNYYVSILIFVELSENGRVSPFMSYRCTSEIIEINFKSKLSNCKFI